MTLSDPESSDSSSRGEVEELKNITLTLLKEFLSFSASVKADLTAVKADMTAVKLNLSSLWSKVGRIDTTSSLMANTVVLLKQNLGTISRNIKAQGDAIDGFHSQLDSMEQAVETDILDHGEWLLNQTSALVSQLADRQDILYHNLSSEVSSVCSVVRDDPPTQNYTTEPPASNEPPTSTTVSPTSTIGLLTGTTMSLTSTIASPTLTTVSPTSTTEPVTSATESPTEEGYSCGGTSGWRRVAFLNMTDPTHQCPSGWQLTGYSKRTCGRASTARMTCDSATFPTGEHYSRVCGRVVAYQFGTIPAFYSSSMNIESHYVTGLSITHGSPRQHIRTLAGGSFESRDGNTFPGERCPCDGGTSPVPDFVGSDYYCESGINGPWISRFVFHPEDRLWDGEGCLPASSCCEGTLLPYFVKELGGSTADDIETRICSVYIRSHSDIAIELVELYVQ